MLASQRVRVRFPADQNFYNFDFIVRAIIFYENFYHFKFIFKISGALRAQHTIPSPRHWQMARPTVLQPTHTCGLVCACAFPICLAPPSPRICQLSTRHRRWQSTQSRDQASTAVVLYESRASSSTVGPRKLRLWRANFYDFYHYKRNLGVSLLLPL